MAEFIRSVRNANPGNIRIGIDWKGLMPRERMTPEQLEETEFCVFETPVWGFRALGDNLRNYQRKDGLRTLREIIHRWAPPGENDTDAYLKTVVQLTGIGPDQAINMGDAAICRSVAKAIATVEGKGWHFSENDLAEGIAAAEALP